MLIQQSSSKKLLFLFPHLSNAHPYIHLENARGERATRRATSDNNKRDNNREGHHTAAYDNKREEHETGAYAAAAVPVSPVAAVAVNTAGLPPYCTACA